MTNLPNPIDECLIIPTSYKTHIRALYNNPNRVYHNTEHICKIWHYYLNNNPGHHSWHERIKITTIFHDVIYNVGSSTNEIDSANYMLTVLGLNTMAGTPRYQAPAGVFAEIYDTIIATCDHTLAENSDLPEWSKMFLDLDLFELGSSQNVYDENTLKIAAEYMSKYSKVEMLAARKRWVVKMLDAPKIFWHFTDRENQARLNLEHSLKALESVDSTL
jgi:predicted metal-dependent HD superfamily phosphohydrolase